MEQEYEFRASASKAPERLDVFLTRNLRRVSRSRARKAIDAGLASVNGKTAKASRKIQPNDRVTCKIYRQPPIALTPENIPLEALYEDEYLLVVDKPAGMCSHPGFGNRTGTLVNALLYRFGRREAIPVELDDDDDEADEGEIFASDEIRPGIVHRLDKDTSGLLAVAKNPEIHAALAKQFADRTISRQYYAVAWGKFDDDAGKIEGDIGRSPRDRKAFAVVKKGGKRAATQYQVVERFEYLTLLKLKLLTGRTHQIRVHCSHINRPLLGDALYGGASIVFGGNNFKFRKKAEKLLKIATRQTLHAKILKFVHPAKNEEMTFEGDLPADFEEILKILREN